MQRVALHGSAPARTGQPGALEPVYVNVALT
jgi:hypothetical protein